MDLSIVVPVYNEEPNVRALHDEISAMLETLGRRAEVIYVDDGSTDGTYPALDSLHRDDGRVRVVRLRRNFGQTAAMAAGFSAARGAYIATLDGDRQNDPDDIPAMLERMEREGLDLISGWRHDRQDAFLSRRLPSMFANKLISWATDVKLHDYGCTLKIMRSEVARNLHLYGDMHRFIPAIASWMGVRIGEMKVNHRPRVAGKSKYGISRTLRVVLDLLTVKFLLSYSGRPVQFFGPPGLVCSVLGMLLLVYLAIQRLAFGIPLSDRPILLLAILLVVIGLQFITFGLLGELQTRTYHEAQGKPIYVIRNVLERDAGLTDER